MKEVAELLVESKLCKSKTEARRFIKDGAVRLQDVVIRDPFAKVLLDKDNNKFYIVESS